MAPPRLDVLVALVVVALPRRTAAQLSPWPQTWALNASTIIMACNYTGDLDPSATASFSIVDVDWSSGKAQWAKERPMQADASLVRQALAVADAVPGRRVFTYRNAIAAIPWFTDVTEKLLDSAYAPWFVPFGPPTVNGSAWHVPPCDHNYDPPLCSTLYHGVINTPTYPGLCAAPACDCGGVPCGPYMFDFRAANRTINGQTLVDWYINDYFFGSTALGNPRISGLYVDDYWSDAGPTEQDPHAVEDMGLSAADVADMAAAYQWVLAQASAAVAAKGKWTWSEFLNNDPFQAINGGCPQPWVKEATCAADLRQLCNSSAPAQTTRTLLYGFTPGCPSLDPAHLASPEHDIANFQLVRGPYAFLGSGWQQCSPSLSYEYPPELNADFGEPAGVCEESPVGSGVFVREFSRATVQMDCATWTPNITWKKQAS